ncbi:hypothetical protein EMIHUDRAFT_59293, partial [Emiliania huxleyi CCMP1516]|uniref:Signal recognition particle 14 kDa protein n=2 Tax=Emiliania huxleyi TaxID=2903 RepID=A0A0D3J9E9_EMIH1
MVLHDADGFLTQLTRMLERSREKGAVYVTMKRCAFAPAAPAAGVARLSPVDPADCRCLVRAVLGSTKATASTMVAAKDHRRFMKSYANIMKAGATA